MDFKEDMFLSVKFEDLTSESVNVKASISQLL
jgi:hypothetical protein